MDDNYIVDTLINSLKSVNSLSVRYKKYMKRTNSLYRLGIFKINGISYAIIGINYKKNIISFESLNNKEIVKYDYTNNKVLSGEFKKEKFISTLLNDIRFKLHLLLKDLSDKLRD